MPSYHDDPSPGTEAVVPVCCQSVVSWQQARRRLRSLRVTCDDLDAWRPETGKRNTKYRSSFAPPESRRLVFEASKGLVKRCGCNQYVSPSVLRCLVGFEQF